jgi:hypothetical protein
MNYYKRGCELMALDQGEALGQEASGSQAARRGRAPG